MAVCNFMTSIFFFILSFLPVRGIAFSDYEQLMLADFFKHLDFRQCIILGNRITYDINLSVIKRLSILKMYISLQTEEEILVSNLSNVSIAPKTVVVYKSIDNVARIREYFSNLHEVS